MKTSKTTLAILYFALAVITLVYFAIELVTSWFSIMYDYDFVWDITSASILSILSVIFCIMAFRYRKYNPIMKKR